MSRLVCEPSETSEANRGSQKSGVQEVEGLRRSVREGRSKEKFEKVVGGTRRPENERTGDGKSEKANDCDTFTKVLSENSV